MSWRASAARPAPPLTSSEADHANLFGAPVRSSRSFRVASSTSGSAAALLARQMVEMDDDRSSVRSARSTLTVGPSGSGSGSGSGSLFKGRGRKGSSGGTSVASARTARRSDGDTTPSSEPDELELTPTPTSAKAPLPDVSRPEGADETVPQVVKRPRVETRPALPVQDGMGKRPGWFAGAGRKSSCAPSEASSTTTAAGPSEAIPFPLVEPIEDVTPTMQSPATFPSTSPAPTFVPAPPTPTPPLRNPPTTLRPPTATPQTISRRSSWFGLSSTTVPLPPAREPPLPVSPISEEPPALIPTPMTLSEIQPEPPEREVTIKDHPASDDRTLTPRPSHRQIASVASQRISWWGWGSASEDSPMPAADPDPEPEPEPVPEPEPEPPVHEPVNEPVPAPPPRSWLQTIWGESPEELVLRRQRESAQAMMSQAALLAGDSASSSSSRSASLDLPSTSPVPSSDSQFSSSTTAPAEAGPIRTLKHTSSWSFFAPRASFSTPPSPVPSQTPPVPSTTITPTTPIATPTARSAPLGKSGTLLSKSPLVSLPSLASSRASSLSSAPPSPRLGPVPDSAPLKPLTGSIRSSQRPGPDLPFENLVLPTFEDTFQRAPRSFPPKKGRLTKAVSVVSAYLFSAPPRGDLIEDTVSRMRDDPAEKLPKSFKTMGELPRHAGVKRVVTIGVHGWFPTPMLRSVFGEPTGTSVKFATMMHDSVQSYLEDHDVSSFNIQAIALEGEGQVEDRVDKLFAQLIGREAWVEALSKADAIFLATHSQGSVVSTHLLARMIERGLVKGPKTHLLAMCGIAQGPFVYLSQSYALSPYFNYVESAPARELFEFQDPNSVVATKFLESLRTILAAGVKMTVVGSINDQVVPLYSALFSGITHPSILRAVYIDSAAFRTSDFLANLVVFASRLRNAGLRDHDLVYHVSEALAGALTGVGHSKIYEEEEVFNLAVRYQLEATGLLDAPTHLDPHAPASELTVSFNPRERRNPYLLTWALRGIIEDPQVRELFSNELAALRDAYETWRPVTKTLKEVKLKLEGIRMLPYRAKKDGKL